MKKFLSSISLWAIFLSALALQFNLYLMLGVLVGVFWRLYHGSSISFALGLTLGILFVELQKFITYRL
jgi:hypothetical protein